MSKCCICGRHYDDVECMLDDRVDCECGGGLVDDDYIEYGDVQ